MTSCTACCRCPNLIALPGRRRESAVATLVHVTSLRERYCDSRWLVVVSFFLNFPSYYREKWSKMVPVDHFSGRWVETCENQHPGQIWQKTYFHSTATWRESGNTTPLILEMDEWPSFFCPPCAIIAVCPLRSTPCVTSFAVSNASFDLSMFLNVQSPRGITSRFRWKIALA